MALVVIALAIFTFIKLKPVNAVASWDPGFIISDNVFYNADSMTVAEIQQFLDDHTPTCDTWGNGPSGYPGPDTAKEYARKKREAVNPNWHTPPYVCLNNYHENPVTHETSFEKGGGAFAGGKSAAQIIYDVAHEFNINPQVLLVTLKKEYRFIFEDNWPLKIQYKYIMGYGCPDTGTNYSANCSKKNAGFYKQMRRAAWQFDRYTKYPDEYSYKAGRYNQILYNPNPSCGSSMVYIKNQATANLYIYTPYQPNAGAIANYPGTSTCGAYGNRNFYYYFNEWFGNPRAESITYSGLKITKDTYTNRQIKAEFTIKNNSKTKTLHLGRVKVHVKNIETDERYDFTSVWDVVILPLQEFKYSKNKIFDKEGDYQFWLERRQNNAWQKPPLAEFGVYQARKIDRRIINHPVVSKSLEINPQIAVTNKPTTAKFEVINRSQVYPINLGRMKVHVHGDNNSYDFPSVHNIVIQPGQSFNYNQQLIIPRSGNYQFSIITYKPGSKASSKTYPESLNQTIIRSIEQTIE